MAIVSIDHAHRLFEVSFSYSRSGDGAFIAFHEAIAQRLLLG
jgi:hypothetical protein